MTDSIETSEREAVTPAPVAIALPANKYAAHAAQPTEAMPPAVLEFWIYQAKSLLNEAGGEVEPEECSECCGTGKILVYGIEESWEETCTKGCAASTKEPT